MNASLVPQQVRKQDFLLEEGGEGEEGGQREKWGESVITQSIFMGSMS